ncbi:NAD(P)H-dependent oxidoreductase [Candidatus Bipolaricaulota bacterium]|nr:NAD(P)H-dependent oxidoreductase [Candidatus Bipolaricaulota bacterium]
MKMAVISYSLTGNNDALAASIDSAFSAEHIRITESKSRTNGAIALDMLFNRTPKVNPIVDKVEDNDLVIFVGPVWMGQVASPLRAYFKRLKGRLDQYAFVSISGGADGPNPKLAGELKKRVGKEPVAVIDLHIADLLPSDPKPTREDTSSYRLTDEDVRTLADKIVQTLEKAMIRDE